MRKLYIGVSCHSNTDMHARTCMCDLHATLTRFAPHRSPCPRVLGGVPEGVRGCAAKRRGAGSAGPPPQGRVG